MSPCSPDSDSIGWHPISGGKKMLLVPSVLRERPTAFIQTPFYWGRRPVVNGTGYGPSFRVAGRAALRYNCCRTRRNRSTLSCGSSIRIDRRAESTRRLKPLTGPMLFRMSVPQVYSLSSPASEEVEIMQPMPDRSIPKLRPMDSATVRVEVPGSPYQFKNVDRYSSHSVILSLLQSPVNRSVLDVGAAHGYLAAVLSERGYRVTGIEANPDLAREAAAYCDDVFVSDLDGPLPEFDQEFDVILYGDVLEHLKHPKDVLVSLNRNLKPGGIVIVSLPNVANIYMRLHLLLGKFDYQHRGILDKTHLRFFTRRTFQAFLDEAGLEVLSMSATPIPLPLIVPHRFHGKILTALHAFNNCIARKWMTLFGYQFIAVARRRSAV